MSEELIDQALEEGRLRRAVGELGAEQREQLIDGLLEQLQAERDALPEELRERLLDGMIDELIAGKRGEREILGRDGVLGELTRRMVERALSEELSEHLGYPPGQAPLGGAGNARNGGTAKTLLTDQGAVRIETPRDRKSCFEPKLVGKHQRRLAGLDEKILALYAGGMTIREIETYVSELYGPGVSRETVSRVTASVLEDAKAWQTRPLEQVYRSSTSTRSWSRSKTGRRSKTSPAIWRSGSTSRASATCWACGFRKPRAQSSGCRS